MENKINFKDLGLWVDEKVNAFTFKGKEIKVRNYLPINKKVDFISYVFNNSIDEKSNTFSPIRMNTFFEVGLIRWYTNIDFSEEELDEIEKTYDKLKSSGLIQKVRNNIDHSEYNLIFSLVTETIQDYEKFANSFIGMMQAMSQENSLMSKELDDILSKISNKEGIEELVNIKNIMG